MYVGKVVFIGSSSVGKTSLLTRIVQNQFYENMALTLAAAQVNFNYSYDNQQFTFCLWDTAGQEKYADLAIGYYRKADIILLTFDLSNHQSWIKIPALLDDIHNNCVNKNVQIIVVANKSDVNPYNVTEDEIKDITNNKNIAQIIKVSAKNGDGIHQLLDQIAILLKKNNCRINDSSIKYKANEKQIQKDGCC